MFYQGFFLVSTLNSGLWKKILHVQTRGNKYVSCWESLNLMKWRHEMTKRINTVNWDQVDETTEEIFSPCFLLHRAVQWAIFEYICQLWIEERLSPLSLVLSWVQLSHIFRQKLLHHIRWNCNIICILSWARCSIKPAKLS